MVITLFSPPMHPTLERDVMKVVPPFALYVLAGVIQNHGHEVRVYDHQLLLDAYDECWDRECILELIEDSDMVGISANTFSWGIAKELIEIIKSRKDSPYVFCGGIHPTFYDEYILNTTKADAVIIGDGEETIIKLIRAYESDNNLGTICNLTYKKGNQIFKNSVINYKSFSDYGAPAYDLIPEGIYFNVPVETSRGCCFHCEFCSILDAHNWRAIDAEHSIRRIEKAAEQTGKVSLYNSVYIVDNCFTADIDRASEILKAVTFNKSSYSLHFEARCTDLLKQNIKFKESINPNRISTIQIGVECGYNEGLVKINKGLKTNMVVECLENLSEIDLAKKTLLSFIIGFPWETKDDCIKTIEFSKYLEDRFGLAIGVNWWLPLKSPMTDNFEKYGLKIDAKVYDDPLWCKNFAFLKSCYKNLSSNDIEYLCSNYNKNVTNLVDMI